MRHSSRRNRHSVPSGRPGTANDIGMAMAGVVVFIAAFLPWYGWSNNGERVQSYSAWSDGLLDVTAILLCVAVGVAAGARVFAGLRLPTVGPAGPGFLLMVGSAAAALLVVIRALTEQGADSAVLQNVYEQGVRYGAVVALFAALVQLGFAALAFQSSGEDLPGQARPPSPPPPVPYGQPYGPQPVPSPGPQPEPGTASAAHRDPPGRAANDGRLPPPLAP
jgi:hypothetical protein